MNQAPKPKGATASTIDAVVGTVGFLFDFLGSDPKKNEASTPTVEQSVLELVGLVGASETQPPKSERDTEPPPPPDGVIDTEGTEA